MVLGWPTHAARELEVCECVVLDKTASSTFLDPHPGLRHSQSLESSYETRIPGTTRGYYASARANDDGQALGNIAIT